MIQQYLRVTSSHLSRSLLALSANRNCAFLWIGFVILSSCTSLVIGMFVLTFCTFLVGAASFAGAVHPLAPPGYRPQHEYLVKKQFLLANKAISTLRNCL
jgi:hypothetical protein